MDVNANIKKEIEHVVKKLVAFDRISNISEQGQKDIIERVIQSLESGSYDFSSFVSLRLTQGAKKRDVKKYTEAYSNENILCHSIKRILDKVFKIRYPNRNKICAELFNTLRAVVNMKNFTIVKFDFKDYFNSVSSIYTFEKYIKSNLSNRQEIDLLENFVYKTKYAYAGLPTSNAIAEIIAKEFDSIIRYTFSGKGLIFYERYIDDSILILNNDIEKDEIDEILKHAINTVFKDRKSCEICCKTKLNNQKNIYITRKKISLLNGNNKYSSVDFLGYEFYFYELEKKIKIKYGITKEKRDKYQKRLRRLISLYLEPKSPDYHDVELLRHRILAFSSRTVYMTKYLNSSVWKVKGFISNYGELRYLLNDSYPSGEAFIEKDTEDFLKDSVRNIINQEFKNKIPPYFVKRLNENNPYNLYNNMKSNRTILLVNRIGFSYSSLVKLCKKIKIKDHDCSNKKRGYGNLVRDYLIKVKVGY